MIVTFTTTFETSMFPYSHESFDDFAVDAKVLMTEMFEGACPDTTNVVVGFTTS